MNYTKIGIGKLNHDPNYDYALCIEANIMDKNTAKHIINILQEKYSTPERIIVGVVDLTSPVLTQYYKLTDVKDGFFVENMINEDEVHNLTKAKIISTYLNENGGDTSLNNIIRGI
jgi:hypothetical protein